MMNNSIKDLGYAGIGDETSSRKIFFTITLPKLIEDFQNKNFNEINLQGQRIEKIILPSNIIDIYTRLEVLLGLKLSGHLDTLTEASNLIDESYKRGQLQIKQHYRKALDKYPII